jgi:hypothetical protein
MAEQTPAWKEPMPPGFSWPGGYRAAAVFSFDMDAESAILFEHAEAATYRFAVPALFSGVRWFGSQTQAETVDSEIAESQPFT